MTKQEQHQAKYRVVGTYQGLYIVGYANTPNEVRTLRNAWFDDSDGECRLYTTPFTWEVGQ